MDAERDQPSASQHARASVAEKGLGYVSATTSGGVRRPRRWQVRPPRRGRHLGSAGDTVYDKTLPKDDTRLRAILEGLVADHESVLMVVDQPATIGALLVAVAEATDQVEVAYLPGLAMRRIADLHPGTAKTDARDALIIAEAARSAPPTPTKTSSPISRQ